MEDSCIPFNLKIKRRYLTTPLISSENIRDVSYKKRDSLKVAYFDLIVLWQDFQRKVRYCTFSHKLLMLGLL